VILASPDLPITKLDVEDLTLGRPSELSPTKVVTFKRISREERMNFFKEILSIEDKVLKEAFSSFGWEEARPRFDEMIVHELVHPGRIVKSMSTRVKADFVGVVYLTQNHIITHELVKDNLPKGLRFT
jgi:hypothetical protein